MANVSLIKPRYIILVLIFAKTQWNHCIKLMKTNSCGVLIAVYGNLNICVKNKVNDNNVRILILEATVDGCNIS